MAQGATPANIANSAQHVLEALALGTRTGTQATLTGVEPLISQVVTGVTIPTAGANAWTSVTASVTGVAVGDMCITSGPTVALSHLAGVLATVTATDTVTFAGLGDGTGFTGAAKSYNLIIFKQTLAL